MYSGIEPQPHTPVFVDILEQELVGHPSPDFVSYLLSGLREGFDIGYYGPEGGRISRNLLSAEQNPDLVDKYLQEEVKAGRICGPFDKPPLSNFQCQPIGIVPKKCPGKFRTIMDLSYPAGTSINDFINKEEFSLKYVTVDTAIRFIMELGRGCHISKVDIAQAFRIMPISPQSWHLLGIFWDNKFYFDTRLSMGGRSSPGIFDNLPTAVEWICKQKYHIDRICHLLDDFLTAELSSAQGNALAKVLLLFEKLGIPIAPGKVEGPTTCLEFLGITLDTDRMEARLSVEKVEKLKESIDSFIPRKKCTKRELLSLVGSLSFACKVIVPGRSFVSRLISLSYTVKKLHHKIYLNVHVQDLRTWKIFLCTWNGRKNFLSSQVTHSLDLDFFTDAAGTIGYGGYFQGACTAKF